jgi:ComF family protein
MNLDFFMDALFPRRCLRCGASIKNGVLCRKCRAGIVLYTSFFCGKCKARIPTTSKVCHKDFPYILGAAASYGNETVKTLIHCLKFRGIRGTAEPLAEIMTEYSSSLGIDLDYYVVVPVPLSLRREHERGFNQSELIGKIFAEKLSLPLEKKKLLRIRDTAPQSATENVFERRENVDGCFWAANNSFLGKNIVLVDDVTTSGATFLEAALAMKRAGAKKIIALAAAMA